MKNTSLALTVMLIVLALLAVGCGAAATPVPPTPTPTPHPGQALVASRCSTCHPLGLVDNSKFSQQGWQIVVDRMIMAGAQLDDEQSRLVIDYLAIAYPQE